ncbi:MAG: ABC transporter substrate-binding protein [Chloroflexota bacterium]
MRRSLLIVMTLLLLLPALAACGDDDDDNGDDPEPTATTETATETDEEDEASDEDEGDDQELTELTIGMVPVLIYAPVMLAQDKGYFAEEGIESNLESIAGGGDMVTLTSNGDFDIGIGGAGPAFFNAIERGVELDVIAPLHFERDPQATPLVVSKERYDSGELDSVEKLEGMNVSVNARGATEYWLDQALRTGGLTIEDIELQELGFGDVPAALESGSLDAAMLGEPLATQAEQEGLIVRLADGFISEIQPTFVFVNPEFAEENEDLVHGFMRAYLQGCRDLMSDDWASDENLGHLEAQTGVPPDLIRESARTYCEPNGEVNADDLETLQEFFAERGLLEYEEMLDVETFIDRSFAEAAVEELGTFEEE